MGWGCFWGIFHVCLPTLYLFATVLDGRNAHLTDGVQQALGRPPKDFATFAEEVANTGIWEER